MPGSNSFWWSFSFSWNINYFYKQYSRCFVIFVYTIAVIENMYWVKVIYLISSSPWQHVYFVNIFIEVQCFLFQIYINNNISVFSNLRCELDLRMMFSKKVFCGATSPLLPPGILSCLILAADITKQYPARPSSKLQEHFKSFLSLFSWIPPNRYPESLWLLFLCIFHHIETHYCDKETRALPKLTWFPLFLTQKLNLTNQHEIGR